MDKEKIQAIVGILFLLVFFVGTSYLIQANSEFIEEMINKTKIRDFAIVFVLIIIIATVFTPISILPLVPLASFAYGWIMTGILITIGQFIGAIIAFGLARKYGLPLVSKLVSLEQMQKYESMLPEGNIFWAIVFLRIAVPADILSYVFGLFSKINLKTYSLATLLGMIPGSFAIAYLGTLELKYQIIAFIMAIAVILIGYGIDARYRRKPVLIIDKL